MLAVEASEVLVLETAAEVRALARSMEREFGAPQLNDDALLLVDASAVGLTHLLARDGGAIVGYAQLQLDGTADIEIAGHGPAAEALLDAAGERAGSARTLRAWAHGRHSPVAPAAEGRGMRRDRVLWQLRRPLTYLPQEHLPADVAVRSFVRGQDEDAWLAVNAAAFAHHAEQGSWTRADLAAREAEDWFDPAGFLLAERADRLVGFHWTKVHPDGPVQMGEVYVLGVDPSAQGLHLGSGLLAAGLRHLSERGCAEVLLYVDESNHTAMRLYERAGFQRHDADVQYLS